MGDGVPTRGAIVQASRQVCITAYCGLAVRACQLDVEENLEASVEGATSSCLATSRTLLPSPINARAFRTSTNTRGRPIRTPCSRARRMPASTRSRIQIALELADRR